MAIMFLAEPVLIYDNPQNITVSQSDAAMFNCSATALPAPTINWYKQLQNGTLQFISETRGYSVSSTTSGAQNLTSQLYISGVTLSDRGTYVCQASSSVTSSTSSAFLNVLGEYQY